MGAVVNPFNRGSTNDFSAHPFQWPGFFNNIATRCSRETSYKPGHPFNALGPTFYLYGMDSSIKISGGTLPRASRSLAPLRGYVATRFMLRGTQGSMVG